MNDDILKSIHEKVEKISEDMTEVRITQAKHDVNLQEHMRRTSMLEETVEVIHNELKPLKVHVNQVEGISKFIAVFATVVSIALGLLKFFSKI